MKHKGLWQLIGFLVVVAALSFLAGYLVMIRFIP